MAKTERRTVTVEIEVYRKLQAWVTLEVSGPAGFYDDRFKIHKVVRCWDDDEREIDVDDIEFYKETVADELLELESEDDDG